jgi:hypothetical protein
MGLLDEAIREHLDLKRRRGADPTEVDRLEREALGPVRRGPQDVPNALLDEEGPDTGSFPVEEDIAYPLEEAPEWAAPAEPAPFNHGEEPSIGIPPAAQWEAEPATEIAPPPEPENEPPIERAYDPPRHHEIAEEWEAHERQAMAGEPAGFEPDASAPAPPTPGSPVAGSDGSPPPAEGSGPVFGSERQRPAAPEEYDVEQETMEHDVESEELGGPGADRSPEGEDVLEETPDFLQDTPDHDRLWFEQRPPRDFDFDG